MAELSGYTVAVSLTPGSNQILDMCAEIGSDTLAASRLKVSAIFLHIIRFLRREQYIFIMMEHERRD